MDHSQPTKRQRRVLTLLVKGIRRGIQPSIRDLMKSLRVSSPNGVVCHLKALEKKGYIKRTRNRSRSIAIKWTKCWNDGGEL